MIGGASLVRYGIMPNYTDYDKAMDYFRRKKCYREYVTPDHLKKIYDQKMTDMLKNGVITEVPYEDLLWINPTHLVPKANGNMRLVMNMTKVNRFMKRIKFKMEGISTLSELLSKNDYAISFDLKDAYNNVHVHPSMRPLLGLAWRGKCYTFVGTPFRVNDAPRVLTMIMRIAVCIIREVWNVKTEVYLGDSPSSSRPRLSETDWTGGVPISSVARVDSEPGKITSKSLENFYVLG
jgi:hypothetical protein